MGRTMKSMNSYGDVQKTAVIESRCDIRDLATILVYLDEKDYVTFTKSDLVRSAIMLTANILVDNKLVQRIEDFDIARDMMMRFAKTGRDIKGEKHISAFVNKEDFDSALNVGVGNDFINKARLLLAENLKKADEQYISDTSKTPQLSPDAAVCSFEGLPAGLIGKEN
jgi:hypothetical protein